MSVRVLKAAKRIHWVWPFGSKAAIQAATNPSDYYRLALGSTVESSYAQSTDREPCSFVECSHQLHPISN